MDQFFITAETPAEDFLLANFWEKWQTGEGELVIEIVDRNGVHRMHIKNSGEVMLPMGNDLGNKIKRLFLTDKSDES